MASSVSPTIVNVGYRSTNFWVVSAGKNRLLVDLGWPGLAGALFANLERMGVPLEEIRYGLATHYHIDHAGAAQDLKLKGVPLLVPTFGGLPPGDYLVHAFLDRNGDLYLDTGDVGTGWVNYSATVTAGQDDLVVVTLNYLW